MFFLLRAAFWLSLVVLLIPADPTETPASGAARSLSPFEAFGAAQSTLHDVEGFCTRNPVACDTGRVALEGFGAKARTGARWVYGKLDGDAATLTGTTPAAAAEPKLAQRAAPSGGEPADPRPATAPTPVPVPLPQARPVS